MPPERDERTGGEDRQPNDAHIARDHEHPDLPKVSLGPHFQMHPVVFPVAASIVMLCIGLAFGLDENQLRLRIETFRNDLGAAIGWVYIFSLTGFLLFAAWLAVSRFGKIRLGADDEKPEFGRLTWFSMLFSAGMGIGLLFWSLAEPAAHFVNPPPGFEDAADKPRAALALTILHWGLHPWALYSVVGLALAYFGFRRGMPLSFRSMLHPLLGDRVWGRTGDVIDTLAIIATLAGVAASLGIGAVQVNAGLSFLFDSPVGIRSQILLITAITAVATVSVVLGLGTGIRRLSEANMILAAALMVTVIIAGGAIPFLIDTVANTAAYASILPARSVRTGLFVSEGQDWINAWTVFNFAWWIAWSPFVGMFIARISRGRTIREFIVGALLVPTAVSIVWLTAFGSAGLRQHTEHLERLEEDPAYEPAEELPVYTVAQLDEQGVPIQNADGDVLVRQEPLTAVEYRYAPVVNPETGEPIRTLPTMLFALLEGLLQPRWLVLTMAGIGTACIVLFFVTSSDSASMVIDIIASGGNPDPPVGTRLFWAITEGLVAAALLAAGGLEAVQAASITSALPFTLVLILACVSLVLALRQEPRSGR